MNQTPAEHRAALRPGYSLLWYRVERVLGQGGFGITYLAQDTNLAQPVAIKEYLPLELAVREQDASVHPVSMDHGESFKWGLTRFLSEAQTLARFDHPNIVRVLSVFEANNTAYMVMRYEEGRALSDMLPRRGKLSEASLLELLVPVMDGLAKVHAAGFIHRDIKPPNLFVRGNGSPVLLDFGSARQALGDETRTLTTLVSPGYAPFEQYTSRAERQGPWTDVYGLAATAYRACTGRAPIDAMDRSEQLLKGGDDPYVPATVAGGGDYSQALLQAIDWGLAFNEEARPQNVQAWLDALPDIAETSARTGHTAAADTVAPDDADAETERHPGSVTLPLAEARRWNWKAALVTMPWCLYHRMPVWGLVGYPAITLAVFVLSAAVTSVVFFGGGDVPHGVGVLLLAGVATILPGRFADRLRARRLQSLGADALKKAPEDPDAWFEARSRPSRWRAALVIPIVALLWLGVVLQPGSQRNGEPVAGAATGRANEQVTWSDVADLKRLARADLGADRLTRPDGNNAHTRITTLLRRAPDDPEVEALRTMLLERYLMHGRKAARDKKMDVVRRYVRHAQQIAPEHPEVVRAKALLDRRDQQSN